MHEEQNDKEELSEEPKLNLESNWGPNISSEHTDHFEVDEIEGNEDLNAEIQKILTAEGFTEEKEDVDEASEQSEHTFGLNLEEQKLGREILIIVGTTVVLAMIIYFMLAILGLASPSRPLVVSKGAAKPFFHGRHRKIIEDNYDGSIKVSNNQSMSVILLYSPYSFKSKLFREEYYNTARVMNKLHGKSAPYFTATNCFESSSYCRKKYNLKQYPALIAQNCYLMGSIYNGPLKKLYVTRWLNRLHNPLLRIQSSDELLELSQKYDIIVILFHTVKYEANKWPSARNLTKLAFHYLDGDPNTERTVFCTVTDPELAAQFQLHNEHDVVIVSSELKLLSTHYKGWELEKLYENVVYFAKEAEKKGVQILHVGKQSTSVQLAEKINSGSVLLYFSSQVIYGSEKFMMLQQTAKDYLACPEKDILSVDAQDLLPFEAEDCSRSLKSCFCSTNSTLSFLVADSEVESQLAIKLGGYKKEMVIAINSKQEITRYIRNNITRESVNCLIRQHHNTADNEFVSETSKVVIKKDPIIENVHPDSIGTKSTVSFLDNVQKLFNTEKIHVVLFSGGVWHSASTSALAPFHMLADYFKESNLIIDLSIIDVSQVYVPYNLNFDKLPKILVTSVDNIGVSWTYPEDFMINHTNIARFVLSRPGKMFGRLRWLNACQGDCRKIARWKIRNKRSMLRRKLVRNMANSFSQRMMIGQYNQILRMMG